MKKQVEWVFLILETEEDEMIFVEENNENNKPWKKQGQYFLPAGTQEQGELLTDTINREFEEETWLNGAATIIEETLVKIGELFLETKEFSLKAHVYTWKIPLNTRIKTKKFNSHEIKRIKVVNPTEILQENIEKIRPGLIEALWLKHGISSNTIYINDWLYEDPQEANNKKEQIKLLYKR
jgi:8-oxo-dGTP pyrophosphatase MutT (NUDIX family)